jgi:hypothetical protein
MMNYVPAQSARQIAYHDYLAHSWRWRIVRAVRRWLDGGRCRGCGEQHGLQAHHSRYIYTRTHWLAWLHLPSLVQEIGATILVCDECHGALHRGRSIGEFAD